MGFTGGPIWGLAWCPNVEGDIQYLALCSHLKADMVTPETAYADRGLIQVLLTYSCLKK